MKTHKEERTCILLVDQFPTRLCNTRANLICNELITLKYHFLPTNIEQFKNYLKDNFEESSETQVFEEKFYYDHLFSGMLNGIWKKSKSFIDKNNQYTSQQQEKSISIVKTLCGRIDESSTIPHKVYMEIKQCYEDVLPTEREIVLNVIRVSYTSKSNENVWLNIDYVELVDDGDIYCVYTLKAEVDEKIGEQLMDKNSKVETKPARSKIAEYLFRYEPTIYQQLETSNHLPKALISSGYDFKNQPQYHPNGVISKWRNDYLTSSEILSKNLGIDIDSLFGFKVNNRDRLAFDNFDKYTQKIKTKLQQFEIDPIEFKPYQENYFISKDLQDRFKDNEEIVHVCYQNMYGYYCVDLYVKQESEILYQTFKQEIDIGFIRITTRFPKILPCLNHIEQLLSVNGEMLSFMEKDYLSDPKIVKIACQQNCMSFRYASDSLKSNVEFVTDLVEHVDGMILKFVCQELQKKEDLVLKAVENNGWTCVIDELREKMIIKTSAYSQRLNVLRYLARKTCISKKRQLSYNAKKSIIEIFDDETYPPYIMHNKLIPIEIISKKIEIENEDSLVLLSI